MPTVFFCVFLNASNSLQTVQFGAIEQVGAIVFIGVVSARLAKTFRIPMLIPLLVTGLVLGPAGFGFIRPGDFGISLTGVAFVIIPLYLFAEGLSMDVTEIRSAGLVVGLLITIGVVITALGVMLVSRFILGLPLLVALLLGSIVSSTDPSAVIPLLEGSKINRKVVSILKAESALNDPTSIVLFTVTLSLIENPNSVTDAGVVANFARLMLGGLLVGVLFGYTSVALTERFELYEQLNYVTVITFIAAYIVAGYFNTSSVVASVVSGLIVGSELKRLGLTPQIRRNLNYFWDNIKFVSEVTIFLLFGLYTTRAVFGLHTLLEGLAITLPLIFLIRPAAVFVSAIRGLKRNEKFFVSWIGVRGSVAAALAAATVGIASALPTLSPYAQTIFSVVLFMVIFTIVVVAFTAQRVASLLGVEAVDRLDEYRSIRARQLALISALRSLDESRSRGEISDGVYRDLKGEYESKLSVIQAKIQEIEEQLKLNTEQLQVLRNKRRLIVEQISTLNEFRRTSELSDKAYNEIMDELVNQLNDVDDRLTKLMVGEGEKVKDTAEEKHSHNLS
ncbi:MAG: cation:proton antiporter [Thermoprotei archaeon]